MVKLLGWLLMACGFVALFKGQLLLGVVLIVLGLYLSGLIRAGRRGDGAASGFGFGASGNDGGGGGDD